MLQTLEKTRRLQIPVEFEPDLHGVKNTLATDVVQVPKER